MLLQSFVLPLFLVDGRVETEKRGAENFRLCLTHPCAGNSIPHALSACTTLMGAWEVLWGFGDPVAYRTRQCSCSLVGQVSRAGQHREHVQPRTQLAVPHGNTPW